MQVCLGMGVTVATGVMTTVGVLVEVAVTKTVKLLPGVWVKLDVGLALEVLVGVGVLVKQVIGPRGRRKPATAKSSGAPVTVTGSGRHSRMLPVISNFITPRMDAKSASTAQRFPPKSMMIPSGLVGF